MRSESGSILRMFAVLDSGPGRTEGGGLKILAGTAVFVVPVTIVACTGTGGTSGSSSRSFSEKSKSCVESGGTDSTAGNGLEVFDVDS